MWCFFIKAHPAFKIFTAMALALLFCGVGSKKSMSRSFVWSRVAVVEQTFNNIGVYTCKQALHSSITFNPASLLIFLMKVNNGAAQFNSGIEERFVWQNLSSATAAACAEIISSNISCAGIFMNVIGGNNSNIEVFLEKIVKILGDRYFVLSYLM